MSVYLDHIYLKPSKEVYDELFIFFRNALGEVVFEFGEYEEGGERWGGFYVYIESGTFIEVMDPEKCSTEQSVGFCLDCKEELRDNFIEQVKSVIPKNKLLTKSIPSEEPAFEVAQVKPEGMYSVWAIKYSKEWQKEWGKRIRKLSMLSPIDEIETMSFHFDDEQRPAIAESFSWVDDRIADGANIPIAQKDFKEIDVAFQRAVANSVELNLKYSGEISDEDITTDNFSLKCSQGNINIKLAL